MANLISENEDVIFGVEVGINDAGDVIIVIGGAERVFPYIRLGALEAKELAEQLNEAVLELCDAAYGLKQKA